MGLVSFKEILENESFDYVDELVSSISTLLDYENLVKFIDQALEYIYENLEKHRYEVIWRAKRLSEYMLSHQILKQFRDRKLEITQDLIEEACLHAFTHLLEKRYEFHKFEKVKDLREQLDKTIAEYARELKNLAEKYPRPVAAALVRFVFLIGSIVDEVGE